MAIYKYDYEQHKKIQLSSKQIREEIMKNLGLDPESKKDYKIYRREYDILRKRVKNFQQLTQGKPISPQEVFLRITRRNLEGEELTIQQRQILQVSAKNTNLFKETLANSVRQANLQGRLAYEEQFAELLNSFHKGKEDYNEWLEENTIYEYINKETGEIIESDKKLDLSEDNYLINKIINVTPLQVKNKLKEIADDAHARQKKVYEANKAFYNHNKRAAGYGE